MKTRLCLTALAGVLMLLMLPASGKASCVGVTTFVPAVSDGRITGPVTVTTGNSVEFFYFLTGPRSFSVEVRKEIFGGGTLTVTTGAGNFPPANIAGFRDTTPIEPAHAIVNNVVFRGSFTLPATATTIGLFSTCVDNAGANVAVTFTISETTQLNPRWSTFGGFFTSWGFQNSTSAVCTVTLTVIKTTPTPTATLTTVTFPVAAGEVLFRDTRSSDLNLAANQAGNAIATHDCPPGGILADAFFLNANATVIVPAKFEAVRESAH